MEKISRTEAREAGHVRYFTGKPCGKGHVLERYVLNGTCVECAKRDPAEQRRANVLHKFGLTLEQYDTLVAKPTNCAICHDLFKNSKDRHLDHCHAKGHVRGVLCSRCNLGLGLFRDNPDYLRSAADYLNV